MSAPRLADARAVCSDRSTVERPAPRGRSRCLLRPLHGGAPRASRTLALFAPTAPRWSAPRLADARAVCSDRSTVERPPRLADARAAPLASFDQVLKNRLTTPSPKIQRSRMD